MFSNWGGSIISLVCLFFFVFPLLSIFVWPLLFVHVCTLLSFFVFPLLFLLFTFFVFPLVCSLLLLFVSPFVCLLLFLCPFIVSFGIPFCFGVHLCVPLTFILHTICFHVASNFTSNIKSNIFTGPNIICTIATWSLHIIHYMSCHIIPFVFL